MGTVEEEENDQDMKQSNNCKEKEVKATASVLLEKMYYKKELIEKRKAKVKNLWGSLSGHFGIRGCTKVSTV